MVDFCCPKAKLVVELDGKSHYIGDAQAYDKERDEFLKAFGLTILRFTNEELRQNLYGVVTKIGEVLGNRQRNQ